MEGSGVDREASAVRATSTASRSIFAAAFFAALLSSPVASAAPPNAPTASQRESARRFMDEGKEHARAGEKEKALEAYQKAHELVHVPSTGIAVAKAHLALGHLIEAREAALQVIRMAHDGAEPPIFERARREAKELDPTLKARIPTVKIIVKGGPAVRVAVDDGDVATLLIGEPVPLNPGHHVVTAKNADGVEKRADLELAERDAKQVEMVLPAPTPTVIRDEPAVRHEAITKTAPNTERTTGARVLMFSGFSLAVVGIAVGGVTGVLTLSKSGSVKAQCANNVCDPAAQSELDSANSLATISTIGFIAGGAGLALGVVGLLLPKATVEPLIQSGLWVSPTSVGLRRSF